MATRNFTAADLMGFAGEVATRNWRLLIRLTALPMLIVIVQGVGMRLLAPEMAAIPEVDADAGDAMRAATATVTTFDMLSAIAAHLALVPACTAWHRLAILGDADRGNGAIYGWDRREWRHLLVYVALFGAVVVASLLAFSITSLVTHPAAIFFCGILAFAFWAASWAALGLALPATALGHPMAISAYLRVAKADLARIAFGVIGVSLICMMIGIALALVIGLPLLAIFSLNLVFEILAFASYLSLVVAVAVWSRAYMILFSRQPPA